MKEPVRILHVLGGLSLGGAESRIMDLYRSIDREKMQFDFLVHSSGEEHFDKEIKSLGGNVYRIPRFKVYNWFGYRKALKRFFAAHHDFRAVHGHMTSTASIYRPIAKRAGVPLAIAHVRSAGVPAGIKGIVTRILRLPLKYKADYCLACSKDAAISAYGRRWVKKGRTEVIPNAIDAKKYVYDAAVREEMRRRLKLEGKFVIGHVGSFRSPKNHVFLLQIFFEIYKRQKNAVLLLLGEGVLMETVKKRAEELGIAQAVFFLGNQAEVSRYYQAFDYLLFPSLYEGLPGTVVEAQTAGLRCLISDTITQEVGITDLTTFYSLQKTAAEWADYIIAHSAYERTGRLLEVKRAGFDIEEQAKRYQEIYGGIDDGADNVS